jgi:hypothetical protein
MSKARDESSQTHEDRDAAHEAEAERLYRPDRFTDDAGFLSKVIRASLDKAAGDASGEEDAKGRE